MHLRPFRKVSNELHRPLGGFQKSFRNVTRHLRGFTNFQISLMGGFRAVHMPSIKIQGDPV